MSEALVVRIAHRRWAPLVSTIPAALVGIVLYIAPVHPVVMTLGMLTTGEITALWLRRRLAREP